MTITQQLDDLCWCPAEPDGSLPTWERVQLAVLMDIRDELKRMNAILNCPNFLAIPEILRRVRGNTSRIQREK